MESVHYRTLHCFWCIDDAIVLLIFCACRKHPLRARRDARKKPTVTGGNSICGLYVTLRQFAIKRQDYSGADTVKWVEPLTAKWRYWRLEGASAPAYSEIRIRFLLRQALTAPIRPGPFLLRLGSNRSPDAAHFNLIPEDQPRRPQSAAFNCWRL